MDISICEVQKVDLKTLKNSVYMTFPYGIYKINDLLPITDEIRNYYKDYYFYENDEPYLVFKYKFDINYLNLEAFGENTFISINEAKPYISPELFDSINSVSIPNDRLLFLGN